LNLWKILARVTAEERILAVRRIIKNVFVFDGTGKAPYAGAVLVDGEHIAAVAEGGELDEAAADEVIDGAGGTLMRTRI
jgi:N-acyl-D-aspartate/D-glutamate deacylase